MSEDKDSRQAQTQPARSTRAFGKFSPGQRASEPVLSAVLDLINCKQAPDPPTREPGWRSSQKGLALRRTSFVGKFTQGACDRVLPSPVLRR